MTIVQAKDLEKGDTIIQCAREYRVIDVNEQDVLIAPICRGYTFRANTIRIGRKSQQKIELIKKHSTDKKLTAIGSVGNLSGERSVEYFKKKKSIPNYGKINKHNL